jgi:tRNA A-37 threonylcarbamoyl transferase component Bud32
VGGELSDDDALVRLAGDVADQTPVNWEGEASRTPDQAPGLARLREIAALQEALARVRDAAPADVLFAWGPLQVLEKIGEGSFAEVYRAWDPSLQREVALKLRRADLDGSPFGARRWIEEARRLARVRHPHVLAILGADEHDGRAGLWTELVAGCTLEDWIARQGPLGAREAAGVGIDLCNALAAVHATGLLHGDVTARNVMREGRAEAPDRSGRIVLMDFGSARDSRSADLVAFGTPVFMAPEVLAGEAPDARSDVYSIGVVLYRLLTGRYPVEPGSSDEMRARLQRGERVPLRAARPDLPSALVAAIERACDPVPARRFTGAAEFEHALALATPAGAAAPPRSRRVFVAALVSAALLVVVAAIVIVRPPGRPPAAPAVAAPASAPVAAVAPASPAATPAPAEAPHLEATLYRVTAGSREALRTGDLVAPGDELALEVDAAEPVHVYVLSEDEAGAVFVLFPLAARGEHNPIAPGAPRRLPGRDGAQELSWQVTSAGGQETFLVLASRAPLAPVAQAAAVLPQATPDAPVAYRTLPPEALARLRGVGGVVRHEPLRTPSRTGILRALARDLAASPGGRVIWKRLLVLENPAP